VEQLEHVLFRVFPTAHFQLVEVIAHALLESRYIARKDP
jgi:hypothetical protein